MTISNFINDRINTLRNLHIQYNKAAWEGAITGDSTAFQREAELKQQLMEFEANSEAYRKLKKWDEANDINDPILARQVRLLRLSSEQYQMDQETIEQITALEHKTTETYSAFRGTMDGEKISDNEIESILSTSKDSIQREKAWLASKQIGAEVSEDVRELARLRNKGAVAMGYANYHSMSLTLNEIDVDEMFALFDKLYDLTIEPFGNAKAQIDPQLSQEYGINPDQLMPWHYHDRFFQEAPQTGQANFDTYFKNKDLVDLGIKTYDGIGMDVRDILERSDLFPRDGKYQHAFCIHMDNEGDVRTLCNLVDNLRWTTTLLHELGHGIFEKYTDFALPWLLRGPNHLITTEAMAIFAGRWALDTTWLGSILQQDPATVEIIDAQARPYSQLAQMIFARWVMVVVNFERALYEDPEQDLNTVWWDLVEKYQLLKRPVGRNAPDWAAKIHIALYPAYYQNYLLGELISFQWQDRLIKQNGGVINHPETGEWLIENVFIRGNQEDWNRGVEIATGEPLNPEYYVQAMLS